MRDNVRWQLSSAHRLVLLLAAAAAVFLSAMSWGMGTIVLLLVALGLLIGAGLLILLLGLRQNSRQTVPGTAYVIMAPPPPVGKIVARCDLRLLIDMPGGQSTMVKLRDPSVPVVKWPRVGGVLPIEVARGNTRQVRVRWDLVDAIHVRASTPADEAAAFAVPFFTDFAEGAVEDAIEHLPESFGSMDDDPPPASVVVLDQPFDHAAPPSDAGGTVRAIVPRSPLPSDGLADTVDQAVVEPADPSAEARARAADFEVPIRGIPQPRPAEPQVDTRAVPPRAAPDQQAMGIMLIVSDLTRSLQFYGDLLGFDAVDNTAGGAVLAYGGGRILLRQVADMSPVDRRVVHLHIQVPDVEAAYQDLRSKGVEFVHRPRVMSRGDKLELWAATFRDPDGHAIALTQWRDREDAPR